jgi:hypothetical protein
MNPSKPRKAKQQTKAVSKVEMVLVFNAARFPVRYSAEAFTVPPQTTKLVQMNEYVERAINKGLFEVRS